MNYERRRARFDETHVEAWRRDRVVLIDAFFDQDEIEPVLKDFDTLYGERMQAQGAGGELNKKSQGEVGRFSLEQFKNFDQLPYAASPAVNLISLHPSLIDLAGALLGVEQVHCYQSHTWLKLTGEADYDQPFHCDFNNHMLVVPAEAPALQTINFVIYLSEVTDDLGALHYVTAPEAEKALGQVPLMLDDDQQGILKAVERSAAADAGALLVYSTDTVHRGTNLTRPGGQRLTLTTSYKAAGNDLVGFHVWQAAPGRPWEQVIDHATPEQLAVLGIPAPGDPYWTEHTLQATRARWPGWNATPYREALK